MDSYSSYITMHLETAFFRIDVAAVLHEEITFRTPQNLPAQAATLVINIDGDETRQAGTVQSFSPLEARFIYTS